MLVINKTANGVYRDAVPRRSLLLEQHTDSRYTRKCNSIYAHQERKFLGVPISAKLTNGLQHQVQMSYTACDPNWQCGKRGQKVKIQLSAVRFS